jgi:uncharacterized membrane protein YgdD (TMEM256/DUF423 family)
MGYLRTGAALAGLAVLLGAFGAHGLESRLSPEMLEIFETGVRYHFYHALGLCVVAWVVARNPEVPAARLAGLLFVVGIVIFSGSLYALALTGARWLGAITPVGGVAFILGWATLAVAAVRAS